MTCSTMLPAITPPLQAWPVDRRVNNARNEGEELIERRRRDPALTNSGIIEHEQCAGAAVHAESRADAVHA